MKPKIIIIIPALDLSGPIKGVIAFANGMIEDFDITIFCLKGIQPHGLKIDPELKIIDLSASKSFYQKKVLIHNFVETHKVSLSFSACLSADLMNFTLSKKTTIISSIRGNLSKNYYYTYGYIGYLISFFHHAIIKRFHKVIAISEFLGNLLVQKYHFKNVEVIGNFIDETSLEPYRVSTEHNSDLNFVILGGLNKRKRPELAIQFVKRCLDQGLKAKLDVIGQGPLEQNLKDLVQKLNLQDHITFLGEIQNPYQKLQIADWMLLTSESEGVSRAALESLYFGTPCILRNVDANNELVKHGQNGLLFNDDNDLYPLIEYLKNNPTKPKDQTSLIPIAFQQNRSLNRAIQLFNNSIKVQND